MCCGREWYPSRSCGCERLRCTRCLFSLLRLLLLFLLIFGIFVIHKDTTGRERGLSGQCCGRLLRGDSH